MAREDVVAEAAAAHQKLLAQAKASQVAARAAEQKRLDAEAQQRQAATTAESAGRDAVSEEEGAARAALITAAAAKPVSVPVVSAEEAAASASALKGTLVEPLNTYSTAERNMHIAGGVLAAAALVAAGVAVFQSKGQNSQASYGLADPSSCESQAYADFNNSSVLVNAFSQKERTARDQLLNYLQ